MNKSQLQHDLDCDALIATAKQRKRRQIANVTLPVLVIAITLSLWPSRNQPGESHSPSLVTHTHEIAPTPEPSKVGQLEIIQSDEELLALLADYGPVLVKDKDGKQSLFITSPRKRGKTWSN